MINDEKKQIYNWINPCFKFKTKLLDALLMEIVHIYFMKNVMKKVQQ